MCPGVEASIGKREGEREREAREAREDGKKGREEARRRKKGEKVNRQRATSLGPQQ